MMAPAVVAAFARNIGKCNNFGDLIKLQNLTTGKIDYYPRYFLEQPDLMTDYVVV